MADLACWKWMAKVGLAVLVLPACSGDATDPGDPGDFVADNPFAHGDQGEGLTGTAGGEESGGAASSGGEGGEDPSGGDDNGGEDGEREIAEADIIQIEGDRLYALSQYGGLTVIDISTPDAFP